MNKYLRVLFLPIMIVAGIFTSFMCVVVIAPIILWHWLRERKLIPTDLKKDEEYLKEYHQNIERARQLRAIK